MQHNVNVEVGAMLINIAFVYSMLDSCWTARVAKIVDNDGCDEWDVNAFNKQVLSKFVSYKANATADELAKQLCATVAQAEERLHFALA